MHPAAPVLALALAGTALAGGPAPAAEALPGNPEVAFLDGWREPDGTRMAAIAIRLDPGWRTYWRVPGEAGIPPRFDWEGSGNLARAEFVWPVPELFGEAGSRYLGFRDGLVLPVRLALADPARPAEVTVTVDFGICQDICVPAAATVSALIRADAPEGPEAARIRAALEQDPEEAVEAGVTAVACDLAPVDGGLALTAEVRFDRAAPAAEVLVVEAPVEDLWIPLAVPARDGTRLRAATVLEYFGDGPLALDRSALRLTLISRGRAVEITGCPAPRG